MMAVGLDPKLGRGAASKLVQLEVPVPELRPRDILIKIEATGMNPVDFKVRSNKDEETKEHKILGFDGVGTVAKLGSESTMFKVGDKVWFGGDITRNGANAEYCAMDERIVGPAPTSISSAQAAAVPLVLLTAWEGIFEQLGVKAFDDANKGKVFLILPAAGGVGSFVTQIAKKMCGFTVVGTASRPESEAAVKALGADIVINHRKPLKEQLEKHGLSGVDYIFNAYQTDKNFEQYCDIINPLGSIVSIAEIEKPLPMMGLFFKRVKFSWELMFTRAIFGVDMEKQNAILANGASLIDSGLLKLPDVTVHKFSEENLRKVHEQQETGKMIGKQVLEM